MSTKGHDRLMNDDKVKYLGRSQEHVIFVDPSSVTLHYLMGCSLRYYGMHLPGLYLVKFSHPITCSTISFT